MSNIKKIKWNKRIKQIDTQIEKEKEKHKVKISNLHFEKVILTDKIKEYQVKKHEGKL